MLIRFADAGPERASGSEMDEQRKQQMAYQYLCHLEEAKVCVEANVPSEFLQYTTLNTAFVRCLDSNVRNTHP